MKNQRLLLLWCVLLSSSILAKSSKEKFETISPPRAKGAWARFLSTPPPSQKFSSNVAQIDRKAIQLIEQERFYEAISLFNDSLELAPMNAYATSNRGVAKLALGLYDAAIQDFQDALKLHPDYHPTLVKPLSEAYRRRARKRFTQNNLTGAKEDIERAVQIDPSNPDAYAERGRLYHEMKEWANCVDAPSNRSIGTSAQIGSGFITRTACRSLMSEYSETLNSLTTAIHLYPKRADNYAKRATVYYGLRAYKEALADAETAIKLNNQLKSTLQILVDNCRNQIK